MEQALGIGRGSRQTSMSLLGDLTSLRARACPPALEGPGRGDVGGPFADYLRLKQEPQTSWAGGGPKSYSVGCVPLEPIMTCIQTCLVSEQGVGIGYEYIGPYPTHPFQYRITCILILIYYYILILLSGIRVQVRLVRSWNILILLYCHIIILLSCYNIILLCGYTIILS